MNDKRKSATDLTPCMAQNSNEPQPQLWDEAEGDLIIHQYSRADALSDGVLRDATELAREAGIRYPVALTSAVWHTCVELPPADTVHDETGRLWDVLFVLRCEIARSRNTDTVYFSVMVCDEHEKVKCVRLKAVCGPGDDAAPVITVMLPDED